MSNLYHVDDLVTVTAEFRVSGVLADPTTISLRFGEAALTTWVFGGAGSVVRDSVGKYHADLDTTDRPGLWLYEWKGTGAAQAARAGAFSVSQGT